MLVQQDTLRSVEYRRFIPSADRCLYFLTRFPYLAFEVVEIESLLAVLIELLHPMFRAEKAMRETMRPSV